MQGFHRLDYQPLFEKRARAPPPTPERLGEKRRPDSSEQRRSRLRFQRAHGTKNVNQVGSAMLNLRGRKGGIRSGKVNHKKDTEASVTSYHRIKRIQFSSGYKMSMSFVERPRR